MPGRRAAHAQPCFPEMGAGAQGSQGPCWGRCAALLGRQVPQRAAQRRLGAGAVRGRPRCLLAARRGQQRLPWAATIWRLTAPVRRPAHAVWCASLRRAAVWHPGSTAVWHAAAAVWGRATWAGSLPCSTLPAGPRRRVLASRRPARRTCIPRRPARRTSLPSLPADWRRSGSSRTLSPNLRRRRGQN